MACVDARHARGPSVDVSAEWARWLLVHREQLASVSMLAGARGLLRITAELVISVQLAGLPP